MRTLVTDIKSYGNVLGFSGTNMRYVTITRRSGSTTAPGIVPNALDTEKFAPPEDNVITDNDVFWNNFNYYKGAPFKLRAERDVACPTRSASASCSSAAGATASRTTASTATTSSASAALQQLLLKQQDAQDLVGNSGQFNQFGLDGTDPNGRDLFYDGNGTGNCFSDNTGAQVTFPADGSTFAACPFTGANAFNADAQQPGRRLGARRRPRGALDPQPHAAERGPHAARALDEARRAPVSGPSRSGEHGRQAERHGRRLLLRAREADGEARHDARVALAVGRRRRARRRARSRAQGRAAFASDIANTGLHVQAQADQAGRLRLQLLAAPGDGDAGEGQVVTVRSRSPASGDAGSHPRRLRSGA